MDATARQVARPRLPQIKLLRLLLSFGPLPLPSRGLTHYPQGSQLGQNHLAHCGSHAPLRRVPAAGTAPQEGGDGCWQQREKPGESKELLLWLTVGRAPAGVVRVVCFDLYSRSSQKYQYLAICKVRQTG